MISYAAHSPFSLVDAKLVSDDALYIFFFPLPIKTLSRPGEKPHEEQLDKVGVEEEELCPLVALRPCVSLHRAARVGSRFGQKDVLERPHLHIRPVSIRFGSKSVDNY